MGPRTCVFVGTGMAMAMAKMEPKVLRLRLGCNWKKLVDVLIVGDAGKLGGHMLEAKGLGLW